MINKIGFQKLLCKLNVTAYAENAICYTAHSKITMRVFFVLRTFRKNLLCEFINIILLPLLSKVFQLQKSISYCFY